MEAIVTGEFFGELTYKMDAKTRVVNPMYDEKAEDQTVYLLINAKQNVYDRCILCMNTEQFKEYYQKLVRVPRGTSAYELVKHVLSSVTKVKTDKMGKILIPRHLKEYAGLDESVTYRGAEESVELWSSERLSEKRNKDFADEDAYRYLTRYINGSCDDYGDAANYIKTVDALEREINILELTSKRDALLERKAGE